MIDMFESILIIAATVILQSVVILVIGNRFLKFAAQMVSKMFTEPTIAKAFGILGGKSGENRRNKALENEIASDVIGATIGKFKPILGAIGIDIDDLIERYGAMEVLGMVNTFLPMLKNAGIDVSSLMQGGIGGLLDQVTGQGQPPQTSNSEMK